MARKSLRLWTLSADKVPTDIRLERVRVGTGDPVWIFPRQTVEDIVPLFAAYGPSRFETSLPEWLTEESAWELMRWEFIGLPMLMLLAGVAGWGVYRLARIAERASNSRIAGRVVGATRTPLIIATVTTVLWWGVTTIFVFSGKLDAILSPAVAIGFVTASLMLVMNVFEAILDRVVGSENIDLAHRQGARQRATATRLAAVRRILAVTIFLVGAGIVLSTANWFPSLGYSLLASAGAITLVVGFAARRILGNMLASLQIALNQSARIGDRVVFKDHLCHVERINFTFVQLRDWDGTRLVVPVEEFISETFENWTLKEPEMLRILKFKLKPEVDMDALRSAFAEVIDGLDQDELDDTSKAKVVVTGQDVFGIDVWFYVPCQDPNTSWDVACDAREQLISKINAIETDRSVAIFPEAAAAEAA
jgi:small-conductance mechanosensitive channel